jgi:hypothetical protein
MPVRDAWAKLQSRSGEPIAGLIALRLHPESNLDIFAAIDPQNGHRILLLKSTIPPLHKLSDLPEGAGFRLQFREMARDKTGPYSLRFELMDSAYVDVFDVVADDVVAHIITLSRSPQAFETFAARIAQWQTFLNAMPPTGLSEHQQRGLLAELQFLRDVLLEPCGPESAVGAWAGPKAMAKDFQFLRVAFEVKATSSKEPIRFRISNEIQLEHTEEMRLFLYGCIFERVLSGGESLGAAVTSLRELLRPSMFASLRFNQLLLQTGYLEVHADRYESPLKIRSRHFFEVIEGFPRLIGSDLPNGVADLRYSILLSECRRFEVSESQIQKLLTELEK